MDTERSWRPGICFGLRTGTTDSPLSLLILVRKWLLGLREEGARLRGSRVSFGSENVPF